MNKKIHCRTSVREISRSIDSRIIGTMDKENPNVGHALVGSPSCGDALGVYILIQNQRVKDVKIKIFGCASAMSSAELMAKKLKGKSIEEIAQIKDKEIAQELNLEPIKFHCSVLAEAAIKAAIKDYEKKQGGGFL